MESKKANPPTSKFIEIFVLAFWVIGFGVVYMLSEGWG